MNEIVNTIKKTVEQIFGINTDVQLSRPDPKFGDFATNVALLITKQVGKNPREIAELLKDELVKTGQFADVEVAGPGFINIRIKNEVLSKVLESVINDPIDYGKPDLYKNKVVVAEYSDPNPFKVLHVGHLYTSIIGDTMANLIENAGGEVHRVNFGGDVGLHVAKAMWAITKKIDNDPERLNDIVENDRASWLSARYVEGSSAYEDSEDSKSEIVAMNKKVYQIHSEKDHESYLAQIYWTCRKWSYEYFDAFYARIGTKFEKYYPESENAGLGLATVLEQRDKGVYKNSNGAVIFEGEPYGLHTRVFVNKEGLPTYEAKDVGLSIKKWDDYHFDQSVIITANDIIEYMKVVIKSIEQFRPELAERTCHITHGNVKLVGCVKMSSRKGNFLKAVDVLDVTADANQEAQGNRDDAPVIGAVKYAFLKNKVGADTVFDPKESVSLQGNSGPYLQYALARAKSIIGKTTNENYCVDSSKCDYSQYERNLLVKISDYPGIVELATVNLMPHHLCGYLYELAQEFNRFYENSRVVGDDREQIRLCLVKAYSVVLEKGLKILGIPTPDRM